MLIDSHAHLGYDPLYQQIEQILQRALSLGVSKIVNICTDQITLERGLALHKKYPFIFNVGATTPQDTLKQGDMHFSLFENAALSGQLQAIGETGLDYFYDFSPKEIQQKWFVKYLELACQTNLPIVIHCRDAFEDLFSITKEFYLDKPLLLHCFTGDQEHAKKALDRGWQISFSGIVTFKKSLHLQNAARYVPLENMLIETDSPYLAPQSKRGQTNEPSFILETAKFLAELKGVSLEKLCQITAENAENFFHV
jgi:TatD DNase family protein